MVFFAGLANFRSPLRGDVKPLTGIRSQNTLIEMSGVVGLTRGTSYFLEYCRLGLLVAISNANGGSEEVLANLRAGSRQCAVGAYVVGSTSQRANRIPLGTELVD